MPKIEVFQRKSLFNPYWQITDKIQKLEYNPASFAFELLFENPGNPVKNPDYMVIILIFSDFCGHPSAIYGKNLVNFYSGFWNRKWRSVTYPKYFFFKIDRIYFELIIRIFFLKWRFIAFWNDSRPFFALCNDLELFTNSQKAFILMALGHLNQSNKRWYP